MKTWLKGGIIVLVIVLFLDIIFGFMGGFSVNSRNSVFVIINFIGLIPCIIYSMQGFPYNMNIDSNVVSFLWNIGIILNLAVSFLLGGLIGLIMEKIKSKK